MPAAILIIAEIRLYREGLARSLEAMAFTVTGSVATLDEALATVSTREPDVILVDIAGAAAPAIARALAERLAGVPIVALAVPERESYVIACAEAGVSSYVPREASLADLASAIEAAARGEVYCPPRVAAGLLRHVRSLGTARGARRSPELSILTSRERQILELVDQGLSNKEIAGRLYIEVPTVKNHIHNILEKLQVHRRSEAAARARSMR